MRWIERDSSMEREMRGVRLPANLGRLALTVTRRGRGVVTVGRWCKAVNGPWRWLYRRLETHAHQCDHCGTIWRHGVSKRGNEAAHMCPECGTGPHWFQMWE